MADVIATRDNLADRLRDSGLRVVTDLRDANPPCVLVAPETLEMAFGGVYGSTYSVSFIAPDVGFDRAHELLVSLIETAAGVIPLGSEIRTSTIQLSGTPPLPAYTARVEC